MTFYQQLVEETEQERQFMYNRSVLLRAVKGEWNLNEYRCYLTQAYHHVKHTIPLLMRCGSALPAEYRWLQNAMAEYIEEELGHEEWVLNDIAATGGDKEQVRASHPAISTDNMIAYAYYSIDHIHPVTFLGMIFVLEGCSVDLASNVAEGLKATLGVDKAFSYLTSHGIVDKEHIHFLASLLNQIDNKHDQALISHMAKRMYFLFGETIANAVELGAQTQEKV